MPKIWNLQSRIIFSSRIECRPVPNWNMNRSTLKRGSNSCVLVSEVKKIKIVVRCLAWLQIKPVDTLNHLNCLQIIKKLSYKIVLVAKRIYFRVRKVKWVTKKYKLVGGVKVPYEHPPTGLSEINFFYWFLSSFWWNMLARSKSLAILSK